MSQGGLDRDGFARRLGFPDHAALVAASRDLGPQGAGVPWYVTPLRNGTFAAWGEAELAAGRARRFRSDGEAAEFHLWGAVEDYYTRHGAEPEIDRLWDRDGRLIGFRLSRVLDGSERHDEERFGAWGRVANGHATA
jgi:hypothetical protein